MKTYSLSKNALLKLRRRLLQRTGIVSSIILVLVLGTVWFKARGNWPFFLPAIPIIIGAFLIGIYRSIKQQQEIWESIKIDIGDDYVARQQIRIPEIRLHRGEITSIREQDGGLCITTADKFHSLLIPTFLDGSDFEEIKTTLSTWASIQSKDPNTKIKNAVLLIVLLAGFGIIFLSASTWLVLVVGLAMIGFYAYIASVFLRTQGMDPKYRRNFLLQLGFLLFIISTKLCVLLGGTDLLLKGLAK